MDNKKTGIKKINKSVAYSSQGTHTGPSQSNRYPIVFIRLGGLRSKPNPHKNTKKKGGTLTENMKRFSDEGHK